MAKKASSKNKGGKKAGNIRRKTRGGTKSTEVIYRSTKEIKVENALIENFIGLQKVMVDLSKRFDSLSDQIARLLDLFEISAKTLAKKEFSSSGDLDSKKILEKLDSLSQQTGLLGKGLALIHEVNSENERPMIPSNPQVSRVQLPSQAFPAPARPFMMPPPQRTTAATAGFEKSIASQEEKS